MLYSLLHKLVALKACKVSATLWSCLRQLLWVFQGRKSWTAHSLARQNVHSGEHELSQSGVVCMYLVVRLHVQAVLPFQGALHADDDHPCCSVLHPLSMT
jgi:hypothetical protein